MNLNVARIIAEDSNSKASYDIKGLDAGLECSSQQWKFASKTSTLRQKSLLATEACQVSSIPTEISSRYAS